MKKNEQVNRLFAVQGGHFFPKSALADFGKNDKYEGFNGDFIDLLAILLDYAFLGVLMVSMRFSWFFLIFTDSWRFWLIFGDFRPVFKGKGGGHGRSNERK